MANIILKVERHLEIYYRFHPLFWEKFEIGVRRLHIELKTKKKCSFDNVCSGVVQTTNDIIQ